MSINLPHFEAPPINEVAMGIRFDPIEGLVLPHYGLFWSSLKDEFIRGEEAVPLNVSGTLAVSKMGVPLPRTWLIHKEEKYLIQLQSDIFYFNWRRQDEAENYPRYSTIKPLFYKYLNSYIEFLDEERLVHLDLVNCNLTYINMIPQSQFEATSGGLSGLFPDVSWREETGRFLPVPKSLNWQVTFDIAGNEIELVISIQSARRVSDDRPVFRFEINARDMRPKLPLSEAERWFDLAHEAIVLSFVDLTNGDAHSKVWKRINGAR